MSVDNNKFLIQEWKNPEKGRYYAAMVCQDLFGSWMITKIWGGNSKAWRRVNALCDSYEDAVLQFQKICKVRKNRGYVCR